MRSVLAAVCLALATTSTLAAAGGAASQPTRPAAATAAKAPAYTADETEIGSLLDDPAAAAIIDKYIPGFSSNPQTELARGMTLRQIQPYAADSITDDVLKSIDADFAAMATKRK